MARKNKIGLDYFPLDVDFFEDDKIELISSEFGSKGETITLRLLCKIYRNGYFYQYGPDESLLFAKRVGNGITGTLVDEVVKGLVKRSFFHKGVFDQFAILTSLGIQRRYLEAKERAKKVTMIREFTLIDVNDALMANNVTLIGFNVYKSAQSRVEKSREEESRGDGTPADDKFLFYDAEKMLLEDQISFEGICMAAGKTKEFALVALKKFHLYYLEKEYYPKVKAVLIAGFKRWLLNEKDGKINSRITGGKPVPEINPSGSYGEL